MVTDSVDLTQLSTKRAWFEKVRFRVGNTFGYSEAPLPQEHVKPSLNAQRCDTPDESPQGLRLVNEGTETDLASVPAFMWGVVSSYGKHTMSAVVHDTLYEKARQDSSGGFKARMEKRKRADDLFRRAMNESGVPWAKQWIMWSAVRAGGVSAESKLLALLWVALLMASVASVPSIAFVRESWGSYQPSSTVRWLIAIGTPLVLAVISRWLQVGLVWSLLAIPIIAVLVLNLAVAMLIWLPSLIGWLIENPLVAVLLGLLLVADILLIDTMWVRLALGFLAVVVVLVFAKDVPSITPTRLLARRSGPSVPMD